jgi:hypothetical protein
MKKSKSVYISVVLIVCANVCFAQKKLGSDKPIKSFYSQKNQAFLDHRQTTQATAAMAKPGLTSQKSSQDLMLISKKNSQPATVHPGSNLTPEQKRKSLPSSTITMAQFSSQSLNKKNKTSHLF